MKPSVLLTIDAVISFLLGVLLLVFPKTLVSILGIPNSESSFYPSIFGSILFGIGVALLIERFRRSEGLGLLGAISIDLSGGIALAIWLLFGHLELPLRGYIILWILVFILVGISSFELLVHPSHRSSHVV